MDFELTADQREIQALARELAEAEIVPNAAAWDREHRFPDELFPKLAELGLMGVCVPEEYGGAGADFLSYVLVLEELSRADAGVGVTVAVHTSATTLPILAFGTDEQRARFVPPLARGEQLGAFALTEPGSGSDAGSLRTTAAPDGDGWSITGSKQWITNGSRAGTFVLFARTDPATAGARGVSCFVLDAEHVRVTREEEKLGLNSSTTSDLALEGARVGRDRLLHEEDRGFRVAMATLDGGRIGIAAQALGIAQAAYDVARAYAQEREQFGRRIGDFQAIQWKLADMATEIDAARLLTYRAAWLKQEGRPHTAEGAKAKLFASEMARRQTAEAIQILGGYGYTKEFPVERYYRDAKITEIYEGTSEIQRLVIARSILGGSYAKSRLLRAPIRRARRARAPRSGAVRELDEAEAVMLVEPPRPRSLEDPEPEAPGRRAWHVRELAPDAVALMRRCDVECREVGPSGPSAVKPRTIRPLGDPDLLLGSTISRRNRRSSSGCAAREATASLLASPRGRSRRARRRPRAGPSQHARTLRPCPANATSPFA